MLHFGGVKQDFDELSKATAGEWSFSKIKPFLTAPLEDKQIFCQKNKSKNCMEIEEINESLLIRSQLKQDYTETVPITKIKPGESILGDTFLNVSELLGGSVHFKLSEYNTKKGYRYSTYHTFLKKAAFHHTNLQILAQTRVLNVLFKDKQAYGVLVEHDYDDPFEITARKEVIISAGSIHSPQLLKVSGVGSEQELKDNGIKLIAINDQIGANLHDHLNMPLFVSINVSASVNLKKILSLDQIHQYIKNGTGIFSTMAIIGQASSLVGDHGILLFGIGSTDEKALRAIANYKEETFKSIFPFYYNHSQEGFVMLSTCHKPKSRGTIMLSGASVYNQPLIDPNYLEHEDDVKCILDAMKLVVEIVHSDIFQKIGATIHWPNLKDCDGLPEFYDRVPDDDYLICLIRHVSLTAHHLVRFFLQIY